MRSILILFFLLINFQNCENPKSNEDKLKSNYKDKPLNFWRDYMYVRTAAGGRKSFGHPLCGGDQIGTAIGLNNDFPKPIKLELGTTYEFEGNPNLVTADGFSDFNNSLFILNTSNKNILRTIKLKTDCNQGISSNSKICNGTDFTQNGTENFISNCIVIPTQPNRNSLLLTKKDAYTNCTFNNPPSTIFLTISKNNCQYTITYQGI